MAQLRKSGSKWNTKQLSYAVRATNFINRAITIRKTLIRLNKSHKPECKISTALLYLPAWFGIPLNSTRAATLVLKHSDKIAVLLPGREARNYESLMMEFNSLIREASEILSQEEVPNPKLLEYERGI